jgi:hypothetical protein
MFSVNVMAPYATQRVGRHAGGAPLIGFPLWDMWLGRPSQHAERPTAGRVLVRRPFAIARHAASGANESDFISVMKLGGLPGVKKCIYRLGRVLQGI